MGTNYYYEREQCHTCGYCPERVHIGKKSNGWRFLFRGYPDKEIYCYGDWVHLLSASNLTIVDEYGRYHSYQEFIGRIDTVFGEISHFNIHNQTPMNPAEKKYLQAKSFLEEIDERYWKDDDGHDFSREDFC